MDPPDDDSPDDDGTWHDRPFRRQVDRLPQLSDEELILRAPANTSLSRPIPQMEMQRRLKVSVEALTAETVKSRESAERLTGQLDASIGTLTAELVSFRESSDAAAGKLGRLTKWLIGFTIALVVLTLAVVALTAVVAAKGHG